MSVFWGKYRKFSRCFCSKSVLGTPPFALKEIFKIIHHSSLFVWVLSESWRHLCATLFDLPSKWLVYLVSITVSLKWYQDENNIFPIETILKHQQVVGTRRKMPFSISRDIQMQMCKLHMQINQVKSELPWEQKFYSSKCVSCGTITLSSFNGLHCNLTKIALFILGWVAAPCPTGGNKD